MKSIIKFSYFLVIPLLFSSCYLHQQIASIKTGGIEYEKVREDYRKVAPTNGETYLTYNKNNERLLAQSNIIHFNVISKTNPGTYKAPTLKYPYATFNKKFYYTNGRTVLKPLYSILGIATVATSIVSIVPTFGQSLTYIPNAIGMIDFRPYDFTELKEYKCPSGDCKDKTVNSNVLLDIELNCLKNQPMTDTLTVVDKLPEGAKLNSFKIVSGNGKLSNVIHNKYDINGIEYHVYKLVGKGNKFAKKYTHIKIKQNVTYTFKAKYFINK